MARRLTWPARALGGRVRLGLGVRPLSYAWGMDRGLSVHRLYVNQFFEAFASDIQGHCLEFQDPAYVPRFGGDRVTRLDIIHKTPGNPLATIVADLTQPNDVAGDTFDCIVCPHVLHLVFDFHAMVAELHRILKPGGSLLVAVPSVSMCDPSAYHEYWRFTPEGLLLTLSRAFGEGNVAVHAYGNSLTAAGEIRGVVAAEFTAHELDRHDHRFAVEVCARAIKA